MARSADVARRAHGEADRQIRPLPSPLVSIAAEFSPRYEQHRTDLVSIDVRGLSRRRFPALPVAPLETCEALEQLRVLWHGERIAVHVAPHGPGPGVDTPEDLERVRAHFAGGLASA